MFGIMEGFIIIHTLQKIGIQHMISCSIFRSVQVGGIWVGKCWTKCKHVWEEWHFVEVWNFFNYQAFRRDRGDILRLELGYVVIAAKIQGLDMYLFYKLQYFLIYNKKVQEVRVNFFACKCLYPGNTPSDTV